MQSKSGVFVCVNCGYSAKAAPPPPPPVPELKPQPMVEAQIVMPEPSPVPESTILEPEAAPITPESLISDHPTIGSKVGNFLKRNPHLKAALNRAGDFTRDLEYFQNDLKSEIKGTDKINDDDTSD